MTNIQINDSLRKCIYAHTHKLLCACTHNWTAQTLCRGKLKNEKPQTKMIYKFDALENSLHISDIKSKPKHMANRSK